MITRLNFLATLFAPLLSWFRKKPEPSLEDWSVTIETGPSYEVLPRGLQPFAELPAPIQTLTVVENHLYAFTADGMFEIFVDGTFKRLDYPFAALVKAPGVDFATAGRKIGDSW